MKQQIKKAIRTGTKRGKGAQRRVHAVEGTNSGQGPGVKKGQGATRGQGTKKEGVGNKINNKE